MSELPLPQEGIDDLDHARRLEWWTIGWLLSIIIVMGFATGTSQAMKTAWIEDFLSLVPAIVFLIAAKFERKPPSKRFPFGFQRVNSLAFLIAAVSLSAFGAMLLLEAARTLLMGERVTIGLVTVFGHQMWAGWVMIAALLYSVVPPVILGRRKIPLARRLQDKVLHTDAEMNKADWQTGLAGIAGIVGVGFGLWWADAAAAGLISFSILKDGITAMRSATAELIDGVPRSLESNEVAEDAVELQRSLEQRFPGAEVRMRETGRYIRAVIDGAEPDEADEPLWPRHVDRPWRLQEVSFKSDGPERS